MKTPSIIAKTARTIPYIVGSAAAFSFFIACGGQGGDGKAKVEIADRKAEQAAIQKAITDAYPEYKRADGKNSDLSSRIVGASAFVIEENAAELDYRVAVDLVVSDKEGVPHSISGFDVIKSNAKMHKPLENNAYELSYLNDTSRVAPETKKLFSISATCATIDCSQLVVLLEETVDNERHESVIVFNRKPSEKNIASESSMTVRWTPSSPTVTTAEGKRGKTKSEKMKSASQARRDLLKDNVQVVENENPRSVGKN